MYILLPNINITYRYIYLRTVFDPIGRDVEIILFAYRRWNESNVSIEKGQDKR